ncbi:MAG TPA: tetratricopeptide repeat protein [Vicinamibacterales bacterium]|nr:tetratricopeptide repeat protein [Vicinamibacterales bacterium]
MKRLILAVLAIAVCSGALYGYLSARRERVFRQLIDRGDAALAKDDTFSAIEFFSGAIALKSDAMLGYLKRGQAYRRRQLLDLPPHDRPQAAKMDPASDAALRDLRRAAEIDPLAPRPRELLGDVNYSLHRYDRAAEEYQKYIDLDDRSPRLLYKLALSHYSARRPERAIVALQKAITIDERFAEAHYLLGLCYRDTQDRDGALRALQTSVRLAPAMIHAREELADLYGRTGKPDARLEQLEALLTFDPSPRRQVALGLAYVRAGEFDRAVTTLGHAAEQHPDHPYTYVALGRVWLEKAQPRADRVDLNKALGALQDAVGSDDSSEALALFGRALILSGSVDLAETVLQEATEKRPVDPQAFYYLADAAERRGHSDIARRALLDYRALEGDDPDSRRRSAFQIRLGDLSLRLRDSAQAVAWYQRAVESSGADVSLLVRIAQAHLQAGSTEAAFATVQKALEKDPLNKDALALLRKIRPVTVPFSDQRDPGAHPQGN